MNVLIVGLKNNPHLLRLKEEGAKRGHLVEGCLTSDLVIKAAPSGFEVSLKQGGFSDYDVIYLWAVGKRRWEWYVAMKIVNRNFGTEIVNYKSIDPNYNYYLTPAVDYLLQTENGLPYPKSAIIFSSKSIDKVLGDFEFPLVVKPSNSRQGKNVFKADSLEQLKDFIDKVSLESPAVVIREFIPNDGDIRVFTVGYKAIGAMKRMPTRKGEFRSNISQGGRGEEYDLALRPDLVEIAERVSSLTRTEIAGVDIILHKETGKPYILEVNPGPQFLGLEEYTRVNAAKAIIEYFEKKVRKAQ